VLLVRYSGQQFFFFLFFSSIFFCPVVDWYISYEISCSHGGEYEVPICLLRCTAVLSNCRPTFQTYGLPPSSGRWWRQRVPLKRRSTIILHQYIPEDNSELYTRRRENLKSSGWWRQLVPLKRRSTIILHGSTSQKKILNFILAAVRTWNHEDDGGSAYLWNVGRQLFYTAVHPRRQF
jgi:hypothetical protein